MWNVKHGYSFKERREWAKGLGFRLDCSKCRHTELAIPSTCYPNILVSSGSQLEEGWSKRKMKRKMQSNLSHCLMMVSMTF